MSKSTTDWKCSQICKIIIKRVNLKFNFSLNYLNELYDHLDSVKDIKSSFFIMFKWHVTTYIWSRKFRHLQFDNPIVGEHDVLLGEDQILICFGLVFILLGCPPLFLSVRIVIHKHRKVCRILVEGSSLSLLWSEAVLSSIFLGGFRRLS